MIYCCQTDEGKIMYIIEEINLTKNFFNAKLHVFARDRKPCFGDENADDEDKMQVFFGQFF